MPMGHSCIEYQLLNTKLACNGWHFDVYVKIGLMGTYVVTINDTKLKETLGVVVITYLHEVCIGNRYPNLMEATSL